MATINAVLRPPKDKNGQQHIMIRISDKSKTRYITTGLKVKPSQWNAKIQAVRQNDFFDADHVNQILADKVKEVKDEQYALKAQGRHTGADVLKKRIDAKEKKGSFIEYAHQFVTRKARVNVRTGKKYRSIVKKLEEFRGDIQFQDLSVTWLKEYCDWMADKKGNTLNTINTNLRAVRAILYEAIKEDLFPTENNPFFRFKLKTPKVSRVKLNPAEMKAFTIVEPSGDPIRQLTKDLFLFSFFTYGMRFSDVVQLKWKNIEGDYIRYQMGKTENYQSVKIFPPARAIIDKYADDPAPDDYIFPLLNTDKDLTDPGTLAQEITLQNGYVNKHLDKLRATAGIHKHITFHTARHSFADIARKKGTDLHSISTSLGHQSLKTTQSYLAALDNETTDNAVKNVYEGF